MTHKWNYQPITPEQAETSQKLAQELGISPILGGLLVQRGKRVPHKKEQALADALIGKYDGSKQLRKKGRERQICVLLPQSMVRR